MRVRPVSFVFAVVASMSAASACGGKTTNIPPVGAADAAGGGSDGAAPDGGNAADAGGTPDASTADCAKLKKELEALEDKALECCPTCRSLQCFVLTDSLCCPISTSGPKPEYVAAVKDYVAKCGPVACPAVVCNDQPSNICEKVPGKPDNIGRCLVR